jgi:hypothetical protein
LKWTQRMNLKTSQSSTDGYEKPRPGFRTHLFLYPGPTSSLSTYPAPSC